MMLKKKEESKGGTHGDLIFIKSASAGDIITSIVTVADGLD
jgi:hypothetical protein